MPFGRLVGLPIIGPFVAATGVAAAARNAASNIRNNVESGNSVFTPPMSQPPIAVTNDQGEKLFRAGMFTIAATGLVVSVIALVRSK